MSRVELWMGRGEEARSIATTRAAEFTIKFYADYLYFIITRAAPLYCASLRIGSDVHRGKVSGRVAPKIRLE
jgi:hypothetical protein